MKLSQKELRTALPVSYCNTKNSEYLICIFDEDGRDYTGQASLNNIKFIIEEHNMKELLNNNYEKLKYEFHNLDKNIYEEKLRIANKQLKIN